MAHVGKTDFPTMLERLWLAIPLCPFAAIGHVYERAATTLAAYGGDQRNLEFACLGIGQSVADLDDREISAR